MATEKDLQTKADPTHLTALKTISLNTFADSRAIADLLLNSL